MKIEDFIKAMKILGIAYNKKFTNVEIETWYEFLKGIKLETFRKAIKNIISKKTFLPSIPELLEECKNVPKRNAETIFDGMIKDGYFKNSQEIEKVYVWLDKGIIPSWLKEDMRTYMNKLKVPNKQNLLEK